MRSVAITLIQGLASLAVALSFAVAFAAAAESSTATAPAVAQGPQELMANLSARLFAALDKDSSAVRHNADKVVPLVDGLLAPHFDSEYAARLVLGQHWRSATPDQRQRFSAALYQRLLRTYAGAISGWTADRVKLLPLRSDAAALQVVVHTLVTNSRGAIVPVDYRLRQTPEGWKIFDVVVEGASYMRNYHDDTDEEVARKGLDATIAQLARTDTGAVERLHPSDPAEAR